MKSAAISRFVVVAAIAALVVGGSTTGRAQVSCPAPNYTTDFSTNSTCVMPNNNATFFTSGNTVLRLTDALGNQRGSAWYLTPQPLQNGFSTSFQFRFTNASNPPADGIAFMIQNSSITAIGSPPSGGAMGYGDHDGNPDPSSGEGITQSLAIEFDTYHNDWDPTGFVSHVAIQSCGQGPNTSHHGHACSALAGAPNSTIGAPVSANLAPDTVHKVTIVYSLACPTCTPSTSSNNLHVILDGVDLYPSGVNVDLASIGLTQPAKTAFVGFTAATGGAVETQDILSWTFTPQAQSAVATTGQTALLNFSGGAGNNNSTGYDYNAKLVSQNQNSLTSTTVQVQPILISEEACEKLVDANPAFGHAQCFVFQNADGKGTRSSVLYELTCPDLSGGSCDDPNFFADLGADFVFQKADNRGFQFLNSTIGPYAGWLKGDGGVPGHPCAIDPSNPPPFLFQSNQISSFTVINDPTGITKGKGVPGGSCWVATYATLGEKPPGVKITSPTFSTYHQSTTPGVASYTCSDPTTSKNPATSSVGPYLTAASCKQSQAPNLNNTSCGSSNTNGVISCTGQFDLSVKGLHVFTVTSKDTGGNLGANAVIYSVVK